MSRFRVIKSKGTYYVVTTDSNGLAGGPYADPGEAQARADRLAMLELAAARAAAAPATHSMNITPGYRSPDVEDGRAATPPNLNAVAMLPAGWVKRNTPNGKPLPPGFVPDWKKHHIPIDPNDKAENWTLDRYNEWYRIPSPAPVLPPDPKKKP